MHFTFDDPIGALEASGIVVRRDEFSVQFFHPLDAKFWIRFELPPKQPYHITDLFSGHMTDGQVSQILYHAVLMLGGSIDGNYRFSNICSKDSSEADQEANRILKILEKAADFGAKLVSSSEVKGHRGKHDLRAIVS